MRKRARLGLCVAASAMGIAGLVHAQNPPQAPSVLAPTAAMMAPASKDPAKAPQGNYRIDLEHSSVVARVLHRGLSFNVLRFGVRAATLNWDPAKPAAIALDATVDAKPFYAPIVYGIPPEGPQSLDAAQFPEAKFQSTSVRLVGKGKAVIEGRLTLMGVTKPATINAELVGIGQSMQGVPTVGFTGTMVVNTADFTTKPMARMVGKVTVILDAEFIKS